jgi:nucleotide-binding universal stress UspA family protein
MKILLAVDGSLSSQAAVGELSQRPWPAGSSICVLTAVPFYTPPILELAVTKETPGAIHEDHVRNAEELVRSVAESLQHTGLHVETRVKKGDPRRVIVDEAEAWGADLILLGARGHTAVAGWLIGSVAQSVVRHAPCSVEVVRRSR